MLASLVGQTFLSVREAASAGFFGGADILVCLEAASAGFSPPSRLELAREKSTSPLANSHGRQECLPHLSTTSPLANPMADKNVCPTITDWSCPSLLGIRTSTLIRDSGTRNSELN